MQAQREPCGVTLSFGEIVYAETVLGYQRKRLQDHEVIDFQALDLPTVEFSTRALWYELDELIAAEPFPPHELLGALHALEHGQIAVLPLIAMCDRWDIGGLSTNAHPQTGVPTIFIYDGHPGGVGITRRGYDEFERLVGDAQRLIGECRCKSGCPSCVQSPKCGNLNEPLSKRGALELLRRLRTSPLISFGVRNAVNRALPGPSSLQAHSKRERREGARRELPLDRGALRSIVPAPGEAEHEHLHRRVVADQHRRTDVVGQLVQAVQEILGRGRVQRRLRSNACREDRRPRASRASGAPSSRARGRARSRRCGCARPCPRRPAGLWGQAAVRDRRAPGHPSSISHDGG